MLSDTYIYDALRAGLNTAVDIAAPILGIALVVGIGVGLFQALTSIQEMTITFVPKLFAIFVVFWVTLGSMVLSLEAFFLNVVIAGMIGA